MNNDQITEALKIIQESLRQIEKIVSLHNMGLAKQKSRINHLIDCISELSLNKCQREHLHKAIFGDKDE